jgi:hypothetical protein
MENGRIEIIKSSSHQVNKDHDFKVRKVQVNGMEVILVLSSDFSREPIIQASTDRVEVHFSDEADKCTLKFKDADHLREWPYYLIDMPYKQVIHLLE